MRAQTRSTKFRFIVFFLVIGCCSDQAWPNEDAVNSEETVTGLAAEEIRREIEDQRSKLQSIDADLAELDLIQQSYLQAMEQTAAFKPTTEAKVKETLASLREALIALKGVTDNDEITKDHPLIQPIYNMESDFQNDLYRPYRVLPRLFQFERSKFYPLIQTPDDYKFESSIKLFVTLRGLPLYGGTRSNKQQLSPIIDVALGQIDNAAKEIVEAQVSAAGRAKADIDRVLKSIATRIASLQTSRKDTTSRLSVLNKALVNAQEGRANTFTSVGWMMVLLGLMFSMSVIARLAAVKLYGPSIEHESIINEQTLVEFGGMSFILLTIIILGSTDKLDRQALGALLGTIAGYIFGKSTFSRVRQDQLAQVPDRTSTSTSPPTASSDQPGSTAEKSK